MTERSTRDPADVVRSVRSGWDAAHVERQLDAFHRMRRRRRGVIAVGVIVAAAAMIVLFVRSRPVVPVPVADAPRTARTVVEEGVIALTDGSRFTPSEGAELRTRRVSEHLVSLELVSGSVEADVVPRRTREVRIEAGHVVVTVLGTAFRVTRTPSDVTVAVHRGRVAVDCRDASGAVRRVVRVAGERERCPRPVTVTERDGGPAVSPVAVRAQPATSVPRRVEDRPESPQSPAPQPAARGWRELAREGEFDEAYAALSAAGPTAVSSSLEELLLAADAARLSGHPREALTFLQRAEAQASGDPRAALAAFSSGRVLGQLGRHGEAAAAFERVLRLEPRGSLSEDAMVRAAEAYQRAGNVSAARALARRYLAAHPDGRGAERMRRIDP